MWRNGKRFPCPDCHKTFATQVDLKAHLMRHITQHPYVCFACGKGFKYDHTLDFHIKSQHGAENGTGNTSTGSSGKNESFNLKSLNRKSCKMKREMVDDKSGSSVISGVGLFGIGSGTGTVSGSGSGAGSGIGTGTGLDNQNNNRALNNSSSIGERNKQQRRDQPLIGRLREMDDPIGNTNVKHNKNNKARENCDDQSFNGGISSDIISQHQQHHNQHNQPQHVLTNNSLQIPGSLIEPNSILNGLKFPISLSSYPSCTTTASHTSTLNSIPFVPTTLLPSSASTLTSSLPSSVSSPSLIPSLASSLLTSSTNSTNSTSTATIAKTTTPITTSTANKDKMSSIAANTSNLASNLPLIDFGLQGDLSPRNLQIKSEKVLISVLEGVHPVNEQTYSLYKCCLCGFAFPSLEPVSIHIQSLHSNNLNLTCDKCGATFKWKSELQLHEQLHKAMDQSVNNFILNNGEEIDSNNNNNNSNSDGNNNSKTNSNNNIKNQNNNNVNNIKSKSQLQNHHSLQDHNHPHLQKQLQLQLQQLQQHQHQQQSQQSSRSLIMPSFLQPNLVFMNQYLNSDDHKIGNDNDDIRRRSNIGIKEEDEGNEGIQEEADEESKCDQDENIDEDDGQGLNLSLKPQYKTKVEDVNPSFDKNNSMMMSMMMMRNKNNNMKLNNNINNENDENNNNGHDRMTSMDEPIDLKIESFSDSNNNNINNLGNNIISNSLNFLHSSLLPSSMGLSFPPMPSPSSSTSAAQASATAAAAAVFAKNIAPKQSQLHQQNIGGLNSFQLQNIGPNNVSRSISSPSSSSLSTGTISSVSSSGGATLNSGNVNVNVNVNGIGNIGMGKITEPIGDIEETAPGQFKCRFCDKTFDRIFSVHRHERVHTGYKPCICKECGRGFSEKRNLRHHTIRFHSDGSGRELLKRNRKEKSMASAASFLKKAAVRLLSNSSVEGSAMEEDDIMSNRLTSDNNNNNINININSNNNNNNDGDDGKNDMKKCSSNYNYKNNDNTDGSKDDEFDQRSRISDDISGNTDNYNSTFNCNDKDDNNNNNNNNGDEDDDNNNVNYYNNYHHKQMNMKRMNRKNINNNNICDKEMGSDANGDSNIEDNIGDKICLNSSSLSSSSSLSLSLSLSSSSRRRKSKPSKKISNNIESGDKSDEECEADENVGIKEEAKEGEGEKEMEEDIEGDEDDEEDAEVDDEREEGYRHGHGYRQRRGHGHGQRDGNERERNGEDVNGNEDEDGDDDSMMITGDEEAVGLIDDDYNDDKNNNNNNNTNNDNNSMERRNGENGDEKVNDSIDNINNRKNIENDLNGSVNGNNNNHNLHEGKLRLHGAFFSNYSPRLALVDKVTKRGESSRPMIGPDGRYLYPCGYCQKTFCSSSDLNRHIGFHENVRPFKCEFCDYQSRTNSQLKVHMMRHAGIKQFMCNICNYNGVTQSDLNRHCKTRSHLLRSANICSICSLGFSTPTLLEDHIFKFHDNSQNNRGSSASPQESKSNLSCPTSTTGTTSTSSPALSLASSSRERLTSNRTDEMDKQQQKNASLLKLNANRFSVNNLL